MSMAVDVVIPAGVAQPMVADISQADELLFLCANLGTRDYDEDSPDVYHRGKECREVIQDITRMIRREGQGGGSKHSTLRQLGCFKLLQQDLIPLLIQYAGYPNGKDLKQDREAKATWRMLYALLKLMCQMTMPAMLTFDGAEDGIEKTHEFSQQVGFLRQYKSSMVETWNMLATEQDLANGRQPTFSTPAALEALLKILYMPMIAEERTNKDSDMIELVLLIIRNMIHVPNETGGADDGRGTLQDKCILAFHQVGILDLVISLANDMETNFEFAGYLSEITAYLLRGQSAADLLATEAEDRMDSEAKREASEEKLREMMEKERRVAAKTKSLRTTRHSRFGGSFEVKRLASDDRAQFYQHALSSLKDPSVMFSKNTTAIPKKKKKASNPDLDPSSAGGGAKSNEKVRKILRDFCRSFVEEAYNLIMPALFKSMEETRKDPRNKVLAADEVNYCYILRFMMEFHRMDLTAAEKAAESAKKSRRKVEMAAVTAGLDGEAEGEASQKERLKMWKQEDEDDANNGFNVELVASTLRREDVKYIRNLVTQWSTQYKEDSAGSVLWATRLHHAMRAFHEVLMYLDKLSRSKNADQRDFSVSTQADLFHEYEFLEMIPKLIKQANPAKMSRGLIRDMVLSTHMILRMLQSLQKHEATRLFAQKKKQKKKKKKQAAAAAKVAAALNAGEAGGAAAGEGGAAAAAAAGGAAAGTGGTEASGTAATAAASTPGSTNAAGQTAVEAISFDDDDAEKEEVEMVAGTEFEFNFRAYEDLFADWRVVKTYAEVLQNYRTNGQEVNHAIIKMYHRIFDGEHCDMRWLFYQLSLFQLFDKILNDPHAKKSEFAEVRGFLKKAVVATFFEDAGKYPPLFAEVLFWKDADAVNAIDLGPTRASLLKKKKGPKWTDETMAKLRELYTKYSEHDDALEEITQELQKSFEECKDRTPASVRSKLQHMKLYLTPANRWSDTELEKLRVAYEKELAKDTVDPLQVIMDEKLFSFTKNKVGKLRNQLKKMGIIVKAVNKANTPWTDGEVDDLKELHMEFHDVYPKIMELVDAIAEDPRMMEKPKVAIKKKLQELGLIKSFARKRSSNEDGDGGGGRDRLGRAAKNSISAAMLRPGAIGEIDEDFAMNLQGMSDKIRGLGDHGKTNLQWLRDQLEVRANSIQEKEDEAVQDAKEAAGEKDAMDDSGGAAPAAAADMEAGVKAAGLRAAASAAAEAAPLAPANPTEAVLLQKLVGMLGFVQASESDSDSDFDSDDEDEDAAARKKVAAWAIPSGVLAPRLRAMMFAISEGGLEAAKKKVAEAVARAEYDAIAGDDDEIAKAHGDDDDDDEDGDVAMKSIKQVDPAVEAAAQAKARKEKLAKLVQDRKAKGVQRRRNKTEGSSSADDSSDEAIAAVENLGKGVAAASASAPSSQSAASSAASAALAGASPAAGATPGASVGAEKRRRRRRLRAAMDSSDDDSSDSDDASNTPVAIVAPSTEGGHADVGGSSQPSGASQVAAAFNSDSDSDAEASGSTLRATPAVASAALSQLPPKRSARQAFVDSSDEDDEEGEGGSSAAAVPASQVSSNVESQSKRARASQAVISDDSDSD